MVTGLQPAHCGKGPPFGIPFFAQMYCNTDNASTFFTAILGAACGKAATHMGPGLNSTDGQYTPGIAVGHLHSQPCHEQLSYDKAEHGALRHCALGICSSLELW